MKRPVLLHEKPRHKIVSWASIPSAQISIQGWRRLVRAATDVSEQAGYHPPHSRRPAVLKVTIDAVESLANVAAANPTRFAGAAIAAGYWPVIWVDEISSRTGFLDTMKRFKACAHTSTDSADQGWFDRVSEAVTQLSKAAEDDIPRYAEHLGCGWPLLLPIQTKTLPEPTRLVLDLADEADPVYRLFRKGVRNTTGRPLRIDLSKPANVMAGSLYGIVQRIAKAKNILGFDSPSDAVMQTRIANTFQLLDGREGNTEEAGLWHKTATRFLLCSMDTTTSGSASGAFPFMLAILKAEVGGAGFVRELRQPDYKKHFDPVAVLERDVKKGAKDVLKQAMNWLE